jgi:hypothetical protein
LWVSLWNERPFRRRCTWNATHVARLLHESLKERIAR